jgi:protein-disulfide isomerase
MYQKLAIVVGVVIALSAGIFALTTLTTNGPAVAAGGSLDKKEVEGIIYDYLMENPEVILEAVQRLQDRDEEKEESRVAKYVANNLDKIEGPEGSYVGGNPNGDVTIVEFFDYHCTYCKQSLAGLMNAVEDDGNIRLVLREMPVLGEASVEAAKAAIAMLDNEKYLDFHLKMMKAKGRLDRTRIEDMAVSVGIDLGDLNEGLKNKKVERVIADNIEMAHNLGITGTPAFVINGQVAIGLRSGDELRAMISDARAKGKRS